ncbi:MAG: FUSC family protein, partial [Janthinobacterium lividum]
MRILPIRAPAVLRDLPWADASHAALVSAAPAVMAVLYGEPRLGWSAIAAFWACFADPGGPLAQRLRAMCWVAAVGALFCFLASASKDMLWLLLPLTFLCCTAASFAQLWGPAAAIIGTLVSAGFVVSTELPTP